jgi:hypothetical protein
MTASLILRTVKGSPLTNLEVDNNFSNLNTFTGVVDSNIGVLSALTTTESSNIVFAVNELVTSNTATNARITATNSDLANTDSNVSTVSTNLSTTNTNLTTTNSNIGVLSNLTTTVKDNVVSAVNEIKGGNLTQFASTTSAQLASIISDETGTGSLVFGTSPTFSGLATANTLSLSNTLTTTKIVESIVVLGNTGAAATVNLNLGTVFTATLSSSATLTITNPGNVSSFTLILTNGTGGPYTLTLAGGSFKYSDGEISRTTANGAVDIWFFFTPDGGTTYYVSIPIKNAS